VTVENATLDSIHGTPGMFGSRVTFGCFDGHKFPDMMRAKTIECLLSSAWNDTLADCDGSSLAVLFY